MERASGWEKVESDAWSVESLRTDTDVKIVLDVEPRAESLAPYVILTGS